VPSNLRETVAQHLEQTIKVDDRGHIMTGMHGTYFLLKYLMEHDRNDLIALMARQKTFPGWGNMLEKGATTSWEDWEGNGSRIHDTLISLGSWFIQGLGGIRIDPGSPGFKHFIIRPGVVPGVNAARTTYQSPYGLIVSDWKIADGQMTLDVTVPPNSTAEVKLPTQDTASITVDGITLGKVHKAHLNSSAYKPVMQVQPGTRRFTCRYQSPDTGSR
jgi:alpha-L-rhamnosidase